MMILIIIIIITNSASASARQATAGRRPCIIAIITASIGRSSIIVRRFGHGRRSSCNGYRCVWGGCARAHFHYHRFHYYLGGGEVHRGGAHGALAGQERELAAGDGGKDVDMPRLGGLVGGRIADLRWVFLA